MLKVRNFFLISKKKSKNVFFSEIQQNRDLISTSNMFQKRVTLIFGPAHSMSTFLGRPSFLLHCEPELASHSKTIIDVSYLVDVARKIFEKVGVTISHFRQIYKFSDNMYIFRTPLFLINRPTITIA